MRKPYITLCGASDTKRVLKPFINVVENFNCFPGTYLNSTTHHGEDSDYRGASVLTIEQSDIVVYCILEKYGDITWDTEFQKTLLLKKPYVIMIEKELFIAYEKLKPVENNNTSLSSIEKIFKIIESGINKERPLVFFDIDDFEKDLRREISYIFFRALEFSQKAKSENKLLALIETRDPDLIKQHTFEDYEVEELKRILFNHTHDKRIRKDILTAFS